MAYFVGVSTERDTKGSGETEISQLQVALTIDKQVLWLQVAVQNAVAVAVANTFHQLSHELFNHRITQAQVCAHHHAVRKSLATAALANGQGFHVLLEIEVEEFEDEVELVAVGVHNVEQLDNVGVLHFLEERDLANGGAGNALIFGLETDLLQSNNAVGVVQFTGLVDHTVGPWGGSRRVSWVQWHWETSARLRHQPSPIFSIFW